MWTQSHPQGATFVCGSRFQDQAELISLSTLLSPSLSLHAFLCRYPIQSPRPGCYGDREDAPGVRNYGNRSPDELFDVYCFTKQLEGKSQELQTIILGLVMHRVTNLWVCSTVMWLVLNTLLSTERERAVGGERRKGSCERDRWKQYWVQLPSYSLLQAKAMWVSRVIPKLYFSICNTTGRGGRDQE